MEKERKITAPEWCKETKVYKISAPNGCEIEKVEIVDGMAVVTFKEKERKLPKSWEEFCEMFPIKEGEYYFDDISVVYLATEGFDRKKNSDKNLLPDKATAEAVLALCQLIQLRNAFNGDWVPDWADYNQYKYTIEFRGNEILCDILTKDATILYFKSEELRDEFLRHFRPLIEKLKQLYGIKEGGTE